MSPNKISLYENYLQLLREFIDIEFINQDKHNEISIMLNLIESRFDGMESRIEKLEKEVHTLKPPAGFTG